MKTNKQSYRYCVIPCIWVIVWLYILSFGFNIITIVTPMKSCICFIFDHAATGDSSQKGIDGLVFIYGMKQRSMAQGRGQWMVIKQSSWIYYIAKPHGSTNLFYLANLYPNGQGLTELTRVWNRISNLALT